MNGRRQTLSDVCGVATHCVQLLEIRMENCPSFE
jgi:hypothetical protein